MRIIQLNSCLSYGDAITHHTFEIDKTLTSMGFETSIFSDIIDTNFQCHDFVIPSNVEHDSNYKRYLNDTDCLLIYHYSVFCQNVDMYKHAKNKKIFEYHNITPSHFFSNYDSFTENICRMGRDELPYLCNCEIALGDSEYNRRELVEYGFNEVNTDVLPIFLPLERFDEVDANEKLLDEFDDGFVNILFVGRVAPNKKIEDIIKVFYYYNKMINPKSRLFLVGPLFLEIYNIELRNLISDLELIGSVFFTNRVALSDLKTYYQLANVFICMSEHEGFCVPLLESMYFENPIIAYNSTAIPSTLDKAGVLANEKRFDEIAEMIHIILNDEKLRSTIIKTQNERLRTFDRNNIQLKFKNIIEKVLE